MLFFKRKKTGLRPYGRIKDDGIIQLTFTLPIPANEKGREAARVFSENMGLCHVDVTSMEPFGKELTTFVVYGETEARVNLDKLKITVPEFPILSFGELNSLIKDKIRRPLIVTGIELGSDTYSWGIDAVMSPKGLAGDWGLERYPAFRAYHLRREPSYEEFLTKAKELKADTILVSPGSSQADSIQKLRDFMKVIKADREFYAKLVTACVDTPLSLKQITKLGYGMAFAPRTAPSTIASFIVHEHLKLII